MNTVRRRSCTMSICRHRVRSTRRDAATLGLDDLFDSPAMVIVEWGERFPEVMPADRIEFHLRALSDDTREISWDAPGL